MHPFVVSCDGRAACDAKRALKPCSTPSARFCLASPTRPPCLRSAVRNVLVVASAEAIAPQPYGRRGGDRGSSLLLSVGEDRQLRWWDERDGLCSALGNGQVPHAFGAALCRGGGPDSQQLLLTAGNDGALYQWHVPALTPRTCMTGHTQVRRSQHTSPLLLTVPTQDLRGSTTRAQAHHHADLRFLLPLPPPG